MDIAQFGAVVILAMVILYLVWTIKPLIESNTRSQDALLKRLETSDKIINRNSDVLDEGQGTAKAQTTALEKLAAEIKTDGEREGAALVKIGDGLKANTDATTAHTTAVDAVTTALNEFSQTFNARMEALENAVKQRIPPEQVEELLKVVRATTVQELSQIIKPPHDAAKRSTGELEIVTIAPPIPAAQAAPPENGSAAGDQPTTDKQE